MRFLKKLNRGVIVFALLCIAVIVYIACTAVRRHKIYDMVYETVIGYIDAESDYSALPEALYGETISDTVFNEGVSERVKQAEAALSNYTTGNPDCSLIEERLLKQKLNPVKEYINSYYNITSFSFDSEKQVTVGISFRQESVYRYSSLNDYNGYYNSYMFVLKNVNGSWKIDFMRSNDNFYSYGGEISEIYCYNRAASADRLRFDGREVF